MAIFHLTRSSWGTSCNCPVGQVDHGKKLLKSEPLILIEEKSEELIDEKLKLLELEALLINDRLESSQVVRFTGWRMSLSREEFFKLSGRGKEKDLSEQAEVLTGKA